MRLEYLADHKEFIPIIADWFHEEWGKLNPNRKKDDIILMIEQHLHKNTLPIIFIGLDDSQTLVGTVLLRREEMENFKNLSPWLSSLYVPADKRRQGIGAFLVWSLLEKAKEFKFEEIYLFTEKSEDWYKDLDWVFFKKAIHRTYPVTIMKIKL